MLIYFPDLVIRINEILSSMIYADWATVVHDLQFQKNVAEGSVWHVSCTEDITLKVAYSQGLMLYYYYV